MKQTRFFLVNFLLSSVMLISMMVVFRDPVNIHIYSLLAIFSSVTLSYFLEKDGLFGTGTINSKGIVFKNSLHWAFGIALTNVLVCILSVLLLARKIDFASLSATTDMKTFFLVSNIVTVIIVQFGGWFLQAALLFFVNIIMDGKMKFRDIVSMTGIAYAGFLVSSLVLLIYVQYSVEGMLTVSEFSVRSLQNILTPTVAKLGEYLTLMLIAILIYTQGVQFSRMKALLMATIPSFVILFFEQIFKHVL